MKVLTSIPSIQKEILSLKRKGKTIGFVPTMGALHEGHLSLIRRARKGNDVVVLSIFVNPKQFGKDEDFRKYPRSKKSDEMLARREKVDMIFSPTDEIMYPSGYLTCVEVGQLGEGLCGRLRPGHFRGVATVVAKLLGIVRPDVMYLGQKDAQQAAVIRQMVRDLNFPVRIEVCPTVRDKDGLAMSSRNAYLSPEERTKAPGIYRSLKAAKAMIQSGEIHPATIVKNIKALIRRNVSPKIDYVECVDPQTLKPLKIITSDCLIATAVRLGQTRLIDNIAVKVSS